MRNKPKYNFDNSIILIFENKLSSSKQPKNNSVKNLEAELEKYIDKLFFSYENKYYSYKIYTSKLTKNDAMKIFPEQTCKECGTISNVLYKKMVFINDELENIKRCQLCFWLNYNHNNSSIDFKKILKKIKYKKCFSLLRKNSLML